MNVCEEELQIGLDKKNLVCRVATTKSSANAIGNFEALMFCPVVPNWGSGAPHQLAIGNKLTLGSGHEYTQRDLQQQKLITRKRLRHTSMII